MKNLFPFSGNVRRAMMFAAIIGLPQAGLANEMALLADVTITGNDNVLSIVQDGGVAGADPARPNAITVMIEGDRNGGYASQWHSGPTLSPLMPGSLMQSGLNNAIGISVTGNDNLFAVAQSGENNRVFGSVTGSYNQFAAMQTGFGNSVGFSQNGQGNTIVVSQNSWR